MSTGFELIFSVHQKINLINLIIFIANFDLSNIDLSINLFMYFCKPILNNNIKFVCYR